MTYEELKRVNDEILAEARRECGMNDPSRDKLNRIAEICRDRIRKDEKLKTRLTGPERRMQCLAIDARLLPLRDILKIVKG